MTSAIVLGAVVGLVMGLWAAALVAASRAKSIVGGLLTVVLLLAPTLYFWLPSEVAPMPGTISRQLGWIVTPGEGVVLALAMLGVASLVFFVVSKMGLVTWLTRRMNRTQGD